MSTICHKENIALQEASNHPNSTREGEGEGEITHRSTEHEQRNEATSSANLTSELRPIPIVLFQPRPR